MGEYIEKWSVVNRLIEIENEFQQYKPFQTLVPQMVQGQEMGKK